ncbi:hypothetical protein F5878DRAFT_312394 [Lentinula raphanica]|uniref:Methyltransferase domain-containing protein n=1 Tax=Lentinula raphanica TaxID=153919 RepID=A0AA38UA43_9AGAR|nr:hypothetical protein F5880DRAFT_337321 [Lentinula raphanica]KAJ3835362.1 hypothetical protein F5878DRAFT_312394 [Lentinula raphanica]
MTAPTMQHSAEKDVEALLLKERVFRRRPGDIAYPLNHSNAMIDYDNWDHIFFKKCFRSITMTQFETPPERVLDLGCGSGLWVLEAARQWENSTIVGLDVMDVQPKLFTLDPYKNLTRRIKWMHHNLLEGLPFPDDCFDFVRMSRLGLGVPEDEWQFVLEEVSRIMKPGAALEIIEEDLIFPYCPAVRRRPRPPKITTLDLFPLANESIASSTRTSMTVVPSPWDHSDDDLVDGVLQKKTSLSPLQESPTSTLPTPMSHLSPKSAHSHHSYTSNFIPQLPPTPSPPPPPPQDSFYTDPQDHSRLKAAWDAMLSRRFLAPQLITVLPFYLSSCFVDIKTHPTLHIPLPPNSSSSQSQLFCSDYSSSTNAFNPEEQFELKRSTGRLSDDENPHRRESKVINDPKRIFSWAPMHLARTVQTVKACKEAIWDEYVKLHSPDLPPTITQARLKEGRRAVVSSESAARESFDRAWNNWEKSVTFQSHSIFDINGFDGVLEKPLICSDMTDRIGMRDSIMFELLWAEPAGERPDWRVWRNSLEIKSIEQPDPAVDICRSIRGFVAWKPQNK